MAPQDLSDKAKIFYSDGYKIGMEVVEQGITKENIIQAVKKIYQNIDLLIETLLKLAQKENTIIYCRKGCSWCCHQPVYALTHEVLLLQDHFTNNFSEKEREDLNKLAHEKDKKLSPLKNEALLNSKHPCPLLKDGACIAYEVRPMACRIYLSLNLNSCENYFTNPEDKTNYPQVMHFPLQAGRMMNEGFKAALKQAGWKSQEFRIEEGLLKTIVLS